MLAVVLVETAEGRGSAFFVTPDTLLTNVHVVGNRSSVTIRRMDGSSAPARVEATSLLFDIAVLKVSSAEQSRVTIPMGSSGSARVGQEVFAIGSALGTLQNTVTRGIVSGIRQSGKARLVQTDAAVNPGNSGGPLVNMAGEVVGVNSAASSRGSVGFAVPSAVVHAVAPALAAKGRMAWGWLGVSMGDVGEGAGGTPAGPLPESGALIRTVRSGEPAARAGVKPGDIVVEVAGRPVREPRDLQQIVAGLPPGRTVPVGVLRDGRRETLTVEIGEAPEETQ